MTMYKEFTEPEAIEYCRELGLFEPGVPLHSKEIGDGNLNLVFRIEDSESGKSVIIKQALPYARVVGDAMPLTLDRARIEAEALKIQAMYCEEMVPEVYHFDRDLALTVMQDLKDYEVMRRGLIRGEIYPCFAKDIGHFLARTLYGTSDFGLAPDKKKELVAKFINPELCKITEDLVFTEPYYDAPNNRYDEAIQPTVTDLRADKDLLHEVFQLKYQFMTEAQALVHGDLHTGSIMVRKDSSKVFDPEFAYYGPMGFDIGAVIANLLLSCSAHYYQPHHEVFMEWIFESIEKLWNVFSEEFRHLCEESRADRFPKFPVFADSFLTQLLRDSVGFAGCKMIRRIVGLAHVADLDTLSDASVKHSAETLALVTAQKMIKQRHNIQTIEHVLAIMRSCFPSVSSVKSN